MMPAQPAPPLPSRLRFSDLFDRRIPGISWVLPAMVFLATMTLSLRYCFWMFVIHGENFFPNILRIHFLTGRFVSSLIMACAFVWLGYRIKSAWQASILFGYASLISLNIFWILFLMTGSIQHLGSSFWPELVKEVLEGFLLFGSVALAVSFSGIRLVGILPITLLASSFSGFINRSSDVLMGFIRQRGETTVRGAALVFDPADLINDAVNGVLWGFLVYVGLRALQSRNQRLSAAVLSPPPPVTATVGGSAKPRISKTLFVFSFAVAQGTGWSLILILLSARPGGPGDDIASIIELAAGVLLLLYSSIILLMLFYKIWDAIQDGWARTTPGKAIGLLFVPFFNIYWIFQVVWGFAADYNDCLKRHSLTVRRLPAGLFLAYCVLGLLGGMMPVGAGLGTGILYAQMMVILVSYLLAVVIAAISCDAVNELPPLPKKPIGSLLLS